MDIFDALDAQQIVQFFIENDAGEGYERYRGIYRDEYSGGRSPEMTVQIGRHGHGYVGHDLWEILADAFDAGEFPDYATVEDLFRDIANARRKYQWRITKRPPSVPGRGLRE